MFARTFGAMLLYSTVSVAAPGHADRTPATFEQRAVAILDAGGSPEDMERRIDQAGIGLSLNVDQRIAIDALKTMVRSRAKIEKLTLAGAEEFAARSGGSPAALMLVGEAALAEDNPARSAEALTEAARKGGVLADLISPGTVSRLVDKLDAQDQKAAIVTLARALLDAQWSRGSASVRSYLAMQAIRDSLAASRTDEARSYLAQVASPAALYAILFEEELAPLRTDVEQLAGPKLERHWRKYIVQAREDWLAKGDYASAMAYADALKQAGYREVLVDTFLPRFMRGYNCPTDQVSQGVAQDIADSLVLLGRWSKADDVMARAGGVSLGAYGGIMLEKGEFGRAASYFDRALKGAKPADGQQEEVARAWLVAVRDCAAHRAGQSAPSKADPAKLKLPARMRLLLCLDRADDARAALIEALENDEDRQAALRWLQPFVEPAAAGRFHQEMVAKMRALQRDPKVREVASRYGSILDWALESSAPPQSEFAEVPVRRASPCNVGGREDPMIPQLREAQDLYEKR